MTPPTGLLCALLLAVAIEAGSASRREAYFEAKDEIAADESVRHIKEQLIEEENGQKRRRPIESYNSKGWTRSYNRSYAEFAMDFAAAAYASDPKKCLERHNATLVADVEAKCGLDAKNDLCRVFIAVAPPSHSVFAARGTNDFKELWDELKLAKLKAMPEVGNVSVSEFAQEAVTNLGQKLNTTCGMDLLGQLDKLMKDYPDHIVLFTGHSLGGELAAVVSLLLAYRLTNGGEKGRNASQLQLVTFGQPRTGDEKYAMLMDRLVPNVWRLVNRHDIVSRLPPMANNYTHHGTEVWYGMGMTPNANHTICDGPPPNEDNACVDGVSDSKLLSDGPTDHLHYFDKKVSDYGIGGCQCEVSNNRPTEPTQPIGGRRADSAVNRRRVARRVPNYLIKPTDACGCNSDEECESRVDAELKPYIACGPCDPCFVTVNGGLMGCILLGNATCGVSAEYGPTRDYD